MPQILSFSQSKLQNLENTLHLERQDTINADLLNVLKNLPKLLDEIVLKELSSIIADYSDRIDFLTEQELIINVISPILRLVKNKGEGYSNFANRTFGYDFGEIKLSGAVDYTIASGKYEPSVPYFCFHEYKKEQGDSDPRGQLLAEMLVAQALNRDAKTGFDTIYGCVVVGRNWFWVILKDKEYAVSKAYDSTQIEDLEEIYLILVKIKYIIEDHIKSKKAVLIMPKY